MACLNEAIASLWRQSTDGARPRRQCASAMPGSSRTASSKQASASTTSPAAAREFPLSHMATARGCPNAGASRAALIRAFGKVRASGARARGSVARGAGSVGSIAVLQPRAALWRSGCLSGHAPPRPAPRRPRRAAGPVHAQGSADRAKGIFGGTRQRPAMKGWLARHSGGSGRGFDTHICAEKAGWKSAGAPDIMAKLIADGTASDETVKAVAGQPGWDEKRARVALVARGSRKTRARGWASSARRCTPGCSRSSTA